MKELQKDERPSTLAPVLAFFGPVTIEVVRDVADVLSKYETTVLCVSPKDTDNGAMFDELGATVIFSVITK